VAIAAALTGTGVPVATVDVADAPAGTSALHVRCDVTDEAAARGAVAHVERELGPVSMLVCAAGVVSQRPLDELDSAEWQRVIDASLTGSYLATRATVPGMPGAVAVYSSRSPQGLRPAGYQGLRPAGSGREATTQPRKPVRKA